MGPYFCSGVRARRNPNERKWFEGCVQPRLVVRQVERMLFQAPPRTILNVPDVGPVGSFFV